MKHIKGNNPRCSECFYYKEKAFANETNLDGWCSNPFQCATGVNGHKRSKPLDRYPTRTMYCCRQWEDAEDRLTYFEVVTSQPEAWRTEEDKERIEVILNGTF